MTGFTESLSVQILADSSQFQQELEQAFNRLRQLNQQVQELGRANSGFTGLSNGIRRAMQPLSQVSSLLTRVTQQVRQLSGITISLNVEPAIQALLRLSAVAQQTAAQIRAVQMVGGGGGGGLGLPLGGAAAGAAVSRRFYHGGLVMGPGGMDRVPAMLTAGEFVVQKGAVETLGRSFLERINQGSSAPAQRSSAVAATPAAVHQYGEINIHVSQPFPLNDLVRDLQFQGHRLRNRRG